MIALCAGGQDYSSEPANSTPLKIRYPLVLDNPIYRYQEKYFTALLRLSLDKTEGAYELAFIDVPDLQQSRSMKLIKQNIYDIHWLATDREREKQLRPVRIPLFRGLLGMRIAFVPSTRTQLFAQAESAEDLSELLAGQGRDWPDTLIYEYHRLPLLKATSTGAIFELMKAGRIDYFPRSVLEVYYEQEFYDQDGLTIDPYVAIQYPNVVYFFVRKNDTVLYERVRAGLLMAIEDGSFQQLFSDYFQQALQQANLPGRRIIRLTNPFLPEQTPINQPELWYPQTNTDDGH